MISGFEKKLSDRETRDKANSVLKINTEQWKCFSLTPPEVTMTSQVASAFLILASNCSAESTTIPIDIDIGK